ncbi:tRNA lysidine(34) synthetase TilS [Candidatus Vidania fulgoroideorum]
MIINKKIIKIIKKEKKIALSYSGGIDSNILMFLLKKFKKKIILIHINHNLIGSKRIEKICKINSIILKSKIIIKKVFPRKKKIKSNGIEKELRDLRIDKIVKTLKNENIKIIFIAHNNNDYIETFFINLFRGCGKNGLYSMKIIKKIKKIIFIRPLLNFNRNYLIKKTNKKIIIANDIMNNNENILRIFIRNNIIIKNKFLNTLKSVNKFISNLKKKNLNINLKINKNILKKLKNSSKKNFFLIKKKKYFSVCKKKIIKNEMNLLIHKYGGSSLKNFKKIKKISLKIKKIILEGYKIVVIVSAPGKTTDKIKKIFSKNFKENDKYYDICIGLGEYLSVALLCSFLKKNNVNCNYLTSWQIPIITNNNFSYSKILKIKTQKIINYLKFYDVIVIPGFQGITNKGEVTTIGRGGSDNLAIEISKYLNCKCFMYKDVKGIYSSDPKIFKNSKLLNKVKGEELLESISIGSKILQIDSVINIIKNNLNIKILSSFEKYINMKKEKKKGSVIKKRFFYSFFDCKKVFFYFLKNKVNIISLIKKKKIIIDNINIIKKKNYYIQFSSEKKIKNLKFKRCLKFSIIKLGVKEYSRNFYEIIEMLERCKIKYFCMSVSEIRISFLSSKKYKKKIINIIRRYGRVA